MHFRDTKILDSPSHHSENKFHQYDQIQQLFLGSLELLLVNSVSIRFSILSHCPSVDSGPDTLEEIARFLDFSRIAEDDTPRACGLSKTFPELLTVSRVVGGNREPRLSIPMKLGISTVDKVRGMPLTCSLCQGREIPSHLTLNSLDF